MYTFGKDRSVGLAGCFATICRSPTITGVAALTFRMSRVHVRYNKVRQKRVLCNRRDGSVMQNGVYLYSAQ